MQSQAYRIGRAAEVSGGSAQTRRCGGVRIERQNMAFEME